MDGILESIGTRHIDPLRRSRAPLRSIASPQGRRLEDRQFLAMEQAYRGVGGVLSGDQLATLVCRRSQQPVSTVARWIVTRQIVCFEWQSITLIPMFQFDLSTVALRAPVREVIRELTGTFDDWEMAWWFASPNERLEGASPIQVIEQDEQAIVAAARADRIIGRS
jgi:hypothetical protein